MTKSYKHSEIQILSVSSAEITPLRIRKLKSKGFTLIEVLTVAAIAVVILSLALPALGWMTESREREKVRESIAAQVMAARARAVQNRTYVGVMVRSVDLSGNLCNYQASGIIRLITVLPEAANHPIWNKSFAWVSDRGPVSIPSGVGFIRGRRPTAGTGLTDLQEAGIFFIVFGPDGILRENWPVEYVYSTVGTGTNTGEARLRSDFRNNNRERFGSGQPWNNFTARANRFSVSCFGVYDFKKLSEEVGSDPNALSIDFATNPGGLLNRLYLDTGVGALCRDDLLCRRTFINPYTGLGITEYDQENPLAVGTSYKELEP